MFGLPSRLLFCNDRNARRIAQLGFADVAFCDSDYFRSEIKKLIVWKKAKRLSRRVVYFHDPYTINSSPRCQDLGKPPLLIIFREKASFAPD